ncbi:Alpha/Beta hydrolase protein, partial [Powellomyces hirtus]
AELADIKRHALYAGIAYCFGILDDTWSCGARCRDPLVSKTTQLKHFGNIARKTAGYVGVRDDLKAIIVAFRGSLTPRDFWADAQYVYDEFDLTFSNLSIPVNSQVHQGMLSHYKDAQVTVRQTVQKILKQAGRQDYAIHLSGHSLGGSLASIAAVDLLDMLGGASFAKRIQVWTYGQPRSFNPVMAKWFDGLAFTVTRVAASGDLVPHLPP